MKRLPDLEILVVLVVMSLAAAGCPGADGSIDLPDPEPTVEPAEPDPTPEVDAGPIDDVDAGPSGPLRTVEHRSLMGGMSNNNRFLDPWITQANFGWVFTSGDAFAVPSVIRTQLPVSPFSAPAALISKAQNPQGVEALGVAKSSSGRLSVSVWIGRHESAAEPDLASVSASLLGVYLGETDPPTEGGPADGAVDLSLDPLVEPVMGAGVVWRRMSATIAEGPVGWAYLHITDDSTANLYFAAPVLLHVPAAGFAAPSPGVAASSVRRALSAAERRGLEAFRDRWRDQIAAPPVDVSRRGTVLAQDPSRLCSLRSVGPDAMGCAEN